MTLIQDYCTALDKLSAAIRDVSELLDKHPASKFGAITVELPEEFSKLFAKDLSHIKSPLLWRLRFDTVDPDTLAASTIIFEFLNTEDFEFGTWDGSDSIENLPASWRVGLAPYLPLLLKRADELLELQTAELEQTVSGIYEALEVAKKNGLPTKSDKKRK